jgi:hypothetical protein
MTVLTQVLAHKSSTATFTIPNGARVEMENAIADKLRSDTELVWNDDPEGVSVDVISPNGVWRPRRRFFLSKDDGGEK